MPAQTYAARQLQAVSDSGPYPGEDFYRLKVTGAGESTWVNVTPAQLALIVSALDDYPELVAVPREHLTALVNYCSPSEETDYYHQHPDDREGHVYEHLQALEAALTAYLA